MTTKTIKHISFSILILLAGAALFAALLMTRRPPERSMPAERGPLVETLRVHPQDVQVWIRGYGTVRPKTQVEIIPQVSGRVVALHPGMVSGGFFRDGEALVKIDPRDYELDVQKAQAAVWRAKVQYDLEKAESEVASAEWRELNPGRRPDSPLVTRQPQLERAGAELEAARAELETAKLALERTVITLPFDGCVLEENIDVGQVVAASQTVGRAYGTQTMEIPVKLEDRDLQWIRPGGGSFGPDEFFDVRARVECDFAGKRHRRRGVVRRLEGAIDPSSRQVTAIVEIPSGPADHAGALLRPGMFVRAMIEGRRLRDVLRIPREALRSDNQVWVTRTGRLNFVKVRIVWRDRKYLYVADGLKESDAIVVSHLDTATDGMAVRETPYAPEEPSVPGENRP